MIGIRRAEWISAAGAQPRVETVEDEGRTQADEQAEQRGHGGARAATRRHDEPAVRGRAGDGRGRLEDRQGGVLGAGPLWPPR